MRTGDTWKFNILESFKEFVSLEGSVGDSWNLFSMFTILNQSFEIKSFDSNFLKGWFDLSAVLEISMKELVRDSILRVVGDWNWDDCV